MLPFTKRPGRGEESEENDVVTKDDIAASEVNPKVKGVVAPSTRLYPAVTANGRAKFPSMSDDEMTNVMPSKSIGDALESARASSPRPAAGMPPPSPSSVRPPPQSRTNPPGRMTSSTVNRTGKFVAVEDEDGRTAVRGAPKIVKRNSTAPKGTPTLPTTISPAAVIKATLESARAGKKKTGELLMAPPPRDLLEDLSDLAQPLSSSSLGSEHTKVLPTGSHSVSPPPMQQTTPLQSGSMAHGSIPPGSSRPMSAPPPMLGDTTNASGGYAQQSGGYAQQSGGYAAQSGGYAAQSGGYAAQSGGYAAQYNSPVPAGSASAPGVVVPPSMPAHFMVPQTPYSEGRMDPPGTAVTARTTVVGRPAMSWAMALMAFGLFVGVGAFAVMRGNADGLAETSASFVDPARAGAGAPKAAAAAPKPVEAPVVVALPGVVVPAVPGTVVPVAAPTVAVTAPASVTAPVAVAPPAPVVVAPPPAAVAASPAPKPVVVQHAAPRPFVRPAPAPAPAAEEPTAAAPRPAGRKPAVAGGKPAGDQSVDEEQKKALKALQESQLESTF